jgi:hypothetical protein
MPSSSYRSAPYTVPNYMVKEEPATPVNPRRGGALLIPKPESKAELLSKVERQ